MDTLQKDLRYALRSLAARHAYHAEPVARRIDGRRSTRVWRLDDVQIQRVQPEADALRLRIAGLADSSEAFIAFVQRLRSDPSWRSVEPLSEAKQPDAAAGAGAGGKPLAFQLAAQWMEP